MMSCVCTTAAASAPWPCCSCLRLHYSTSPLRLLIGRTTTSAAGACIRLTPHAPHLVCRGAAGHERRCNGRRRSRSARPALSPHTLRRTQRLRLAWDGMARRGRDGGDGDGRDGDGRGLTEFRHHVPGFARIEQRLLDALHRLDGKVYELAWAPGRRVVQRTVFVAGRRRLETRIKFQLPFRMACKRYDRPAHNAMRCPGESASLRPKIARFRCECERPTFFGGIF